jgi:hypothetical protein
MDYTDRYSARILQLNTQAGFAALMMYTLDQSQQHDKVVLF